MESKREQEVNEAQTNVVNLNQWEDKRDERNEEKSLSRYFNVLGFNELLTESKEIVAELKNSGAYSQELALKARLIIQEISQRVGRESRGIFKDLTQMKKELEKRIENIKDSKF